MTKIRISMIFQSSRHFSSIFLKSAEKELLPGHVAYLPSSRDSSWECLRRKCGAAGRYPGWSYGSRHVALSDDIRRDSPGLGYSGTRGVLGMFPGMLSRWSTRDTWLTRNAPGGFFRRGRSGHVACSEGFRTGSHGLGTRGTWRARKASGGWLSVWASGIRGTLRR